MSKTFEVTENLAVDLLGHKWVGSSSSEVKTSYPRGEPIDKKVRVIAHYMGTIDTKDKYLDACNKILSDPLLDSADIKFDRDFYDTCIYLRYVDRHANTFDVIMGLGYGLKDKDKVKLYSDIAGCNMTSVSQPTNYVSYVCGAKA